MRMRKDQKGFTIVELLIAIAILSIVVASVCGFILVGSRSYASANSDINVQQEAQLSLNQMSDLLIDTTRSVNYGGYDAGGSYVKVLKDAEFTFTPEDKSLVIYNGVAVKNPGGGPDTIEEGNGNKNYHFYWDKSEETLFYAEADATTGVVPDFGDPGAEWVELAGHVTDFSVDLTQVDEKRVVQLSLTFLDGKKEYVTSNNVTIRNKVGVNDAELEALNRKKTLSVAIRDNATLEPGETYHFSTPKVTGDNVADRSVTWSVESAGSAATTFTDAVNGILKVGEDEPAGSVMVKIETNATDSDGNKATCTAPVYIKRVTSVSLAKTADSDSDNAEDEISPGCTFTISVNVAGNKLGETCSACGDDTTIDKQVVYDGNPYGNPYTWIVHNPSSVPGATTGWDPTKYIEILESKPDHATFRLKDDAPVSNDNTTYDVVIQAMSFLSTQDNAHGRHYDNWVPGSIRLKFKNSKKNIHVNGNLQWGQGTKIGIDYGPDFNGSGQGYYLVCARIREYGSESGEKVMIYRTLGSDPWVTPDLFGVEDISRPWYLSLQVIDPRSHFQPGVSPDNQPGQNIMQKVKEQIHDQVVLDVVADYLANCDSSGTYNGKYPHTDKFEGMINPPEIFYYYNGKRNLSGELHLNPVTSLSKDNGSHETRFGVDYVKNTKGNNGYGGGIEFANNNVKFSVYKEKSGGGLEKLYWYDAVNNNYQGNNKLYNALEVNDVQNAPSMMIKLDFNNRNAFSQVEGTYRLIPTIWYAQNPHTDHSYDIYYLDYEPNYGNKQYYEEPKSTIYYEMVNSGNVDAFWSYHDNSQFTKGEIYFPTPSEISEWYASPTNFDYYFNINDLQEKLGWHDAKQTYDFRKLVKGRESEQIYYKASSIRCRYVKDKNVYELELFYKYTDSVWNQTVEASAGVFQCAPDGTRWKRKDPGTYDSQLEKGNKNPSLNATANVNFQMEGRQYNGKMYIPLPTEKRFSSYDNDGFGFALNQSAEQSRDWRKVRYQPTGQTNTEQTEFAKLICAYDAASDTYTLKVYDRNNNYIVAFTCKSNGKQWTQQ